MIRYLYPDLQRWLLPCAFTYVYHHHVYVAVVDWAFMNVCCTHTFGYHYVLPFVYIPHCLVGCPAFGWLFPVGTGPFDSGAFVPRCHHVCRSFWLHAFVPTPRLICVRSLRLERPTRSTFPRCSIHRCPLHVCCSLICPGFSPVVVRWLWFATFPTPTPTGFVDLRCVGAFGWHWFGTAFTFRSPFFLRSFPHTTRVRCNSHRPTTTPPHSPIILLLLLTNYC